MRPFSQGLGRKPILEATSLSKPEAKPKQIGFGSSSARASDVPSLPRVDRRQVPEKDPILAQIADQAAREKYIAVQMAIKKRAAIL